MAHGVGQGLARGGDDHFSGAVRDAVAHDHQLDVHAVAVLGLPDEVAHGVGHRRARLGTVGVEPGPQLALLGAGQAGDSGGLVGALANEGEGLQDRVVQVSGDVGALGLAHFSGAGLGQRPVGAQPQWSQDEPDADDESNAGQGARQQSAGGGVAAHPHQNPDCRQGHASGHAHTRADAVSGLGHGIDLGPHERGSATGDDQRPAPADGGQEPLAPQFEQNGREQESPSAEDGAQAPRDRDELRRPAGEPGATRGHCPGSLGPRVARRDGDPQQHVEHDAGAPA